MKKVMLLAVAVLAAGCFAGQSEVKNRLWVRYVPFYDRLALCLVTVLKENQVEGCANAIFGIISSKQKRG